MKNHIFTFIVIGIIALFLQTSGNAYGVDNLNLTGHRTQLSPNFRRSSASTDYSVGFWAGSNFTNTFFKGEFHIAESIRVMGEYRTAYTYGLSGNYKKNDQWSFQAELNLEQRGMYFEDDFYAFVNTVRLTNTVKSNLNLNYISLPVLANFHFGRVTKWYVSGGLYFSYLRSAALDGRMKAEVLSPFDNSVDVKEFDVNYELSVSYRRDAGAVVGGGFILPIQKGPHGPILSLVLDARYYQGILNVYAGEPVEPIDPLETINPDAVIEEVPPVNADIKLRTSTFSLRLGFVVAI